MAITLLRPPTRRFRSCTRLHSGPTVGGRQHSVQGQVIVYCLSFLLKSASSSRYTMPKSQPCPPCVIQHYGVSCHILVHCACPVQIPQPAGYSEGYFQTNLTLSRPKGIHRGNLHLANIGICRILYRDRPDTLRYIYPKTLLSERIGMLAIPSNI